MTQLKITEVALRDGSHAMSHQYTVEQVRNITKGLNAARVPYIEVAHGDGLGGSTIQYGLSKTDELKLIEAAVEEADFSKIAVLLLPGIGTIQDLEGGSSYWCKNGASCYPCDRSRCSQTTLGNSKKFRDGNGRILNDEPYGSSR